MSCRINVAIIIAAALSWIAGAQAAESPKSGAIVLHVSPGGPLTTIQQARDEIRRRKAAGELTQPVLVEIRGGTYRVAKPIVFSAQDSGTAEAPITYAAAAGQKVVISGGVPIHGWKKAASGPAWTAAVPEFKQGTRCFRSLFVNGRRAVPARTPNAGQFYQMAGPLAPLRNRTAAQRDPATRLGFRFDDGQLKRWAGLDDAVVVVYHAWTTSRHCIASVDADKHEVHFTNPAGWPLGWWGKERFYIENLPEALDAPGEFYLAGARASCPPNAAETAALPTVSYIPLPGEDMTKAEVVAPRTEELLRLEGDPAAGKFVQHLRFEGISFQHTDWTMPRTGAVDGQAAVFLKTATVFARGARNCTFQRCEIARTGGYALWLERGAKHNRVVQCHLHDLGAGGVRLGETSLPSKPGEQAERNEVYNCFIHDGGRVFHGGIGVWAGKTSHNQIQHNEICDFLYSGVSVGWSWGYAPTSAHHNLVEYNHIHHLGWAELSDMGGIYTLGVSPGTQLRNNLIHDVMSYDYGGWGLYTDEGSTDILMENNIVYRVKDGAFHQHYGRQNVLRNNVLALSATVGQLRRSRQEEHVSFTVERNIIYSRGAPIFGGNWSNRKYQFDKNCYWDASGKEVTFPGKLSLQQWQATGQDLHSIVADPKFVNAAKDNFRLLPDSPALKLGFRPIDVGQIGLVGPADWVSLPKRVKRPPFPSTVKR
jgi:hypothetical protein